MPYLMPWPSLASPPCPARSTEPCVQLGEHVPRPRQVLDCAGTLGGGRRFQVADAARNGRVDLGARGRLAECEELDPLGLAHVNQLVALAVGEQRVRRARDPDQRDAGIVENV